MARWRQDRTTGKMIPIDESAVKHNEQHEIIIKGFDAFKSPVDNCIISTQKQLDAHNKRHNVVDSREFTQTYYEGKAKEREKALKGETTTRETFNRKVEMNRTIEGLQNDSRRRQ